MKHNGEVTSPCRTPLLVLKEFDLMTPSDDFAVTHAETALCTALKIDRILTVAPASFKALSMNLCEIVSKAAV